MLIIYNFLIIFLLIIFSPYILAKLISNISRNEWLERLGRISGIDKSRKHIWVHCASVGEVKIAELLIKELEQKLNTDTKKYNFVLSVVTPTAMKSITRDNPAVEKFFYFPIDFSLFTMKTLRTISPEMVILIETEIWPNLVWHAKNRGTKVVVVNGRISDKSYAIYRTFGLFFRKILKKISLFLVREQIDYDRFVSLGADRKKVHLTGNMKYDYMFTISQSRKFSSDELKQHREKFGFKENEKIFTAGSLREGEEKIILDVFVKVKEKISDLKLIIAPRHINRVKNVIEELKYKKITYITLSTFYRYRGSFDVCIVDTMGDLIDAYRISNIIFVGGSLLNFGGQNILEPISVEKIVLFGPYIQNFREPARILKNKKIGIEVTNANELVEKIVFFINNKNEMSNRTSKIHEVIDSMSGIVEKNTEFLIKLL